jgi:type I restriction enzyme S subunit
VIFAKITPCMENGKIAIIPELPWGVGAGSTEFHVIQADEVLPKYLYYWLSQQWFRDEAEANMTGTAGQKRVPTDYLRATAIPVPPPDTQHRIVARIEELFAELDDGESALATARVDLETYRKSLLKAAVTGELTADWRAANPSAAGQGLLLQEVLAERRARWGAVPRNRGKPYKSPLSLSGGTLPHLPVGWTWATLDQLCFHITSGSRAWSPYYDRGASTFIMAQNVRRGRFDPTFVQLVDPPANDPERQRTQVEKGDLLLTIVGANTGDLCRIEFDLTDHYVCQSVALLRPVSDWIGHLCEFFFSGSFGRQFQMEALIYGAGRPHLSFDQIRELAVPIPPERESREVIKAMQQIKANIDGLGTGIAVQAMPSKTLRQAILAAAFRGELTE